MVVIFDPYTDKQWDRLREHKSVTSVLYCSSSPTVQYKHPKYQKNFWAELTVWAAIARRVSAPVLLVIVSQLLPYAH